MKNYTWRSNLIHTILRRVSLVVLFLLHSTLPAAQNLSVAANAKGSYATWNLLPTPGMGQISFSAVAQNDIHIGISPTQDQTKPMYEIVIGGWGNGRSVLRKSSQGPSVIPAGTDWDTAKIPANSAANPANFTVSINQTGNSVTISVTGAVKADGVTPAILTYTDTSPITPPVQYFSFSAWDSQIAYSNITGAASSALSAPANNGIYSTYNDAWVLPTPGQGQISFSAVATNDITVVISPTSGNGNTANNRTDGYEFVIGGWKNTKSQLRRGPQSTAVLTAGTNWDTAKIPANSANNPAPFTISINQTGNSVTITVIGAVDANNNPVSLTYTDSSPTALNAQYVSFSAWDSNVVYSNIAVAPLGGVTVNDGDVIALQSVKNGKFVQVQQDANGQPQPVIAQGISYSDPATQFKVVQQGGNTYLQTSVLTFGPSPYRSFQASPDFKVQCAGANQAAWESFSVTKNNGIFFIKSNQTGGYVSVRDANEPWGSGANGTLWTRDQTGGPAQASIYEQFNIIKVSASGSAATQSSTSLSVPANPNPNGLYTTWQSGWTLPTPGQGQISFSAVATNDITLLISPTQNNGSTAANRGPGYEIVIGGWAPPAGGPASSLRKNPQGGGGILTGGVPAVGTTAWNTARIPANSATNPANFTVTIAQSGTSSVTITVTGAVDANNNPVTLTYTDTSPILNAQYFSFTCWNTPITYSNIAVTPIGGAAGTAVPDAQGSVDGRAKGIADANPNTGNGPVDTVTTGTPAYQAAYTLAYDASFWPLRGKTDGTNDGLKAAANAVANPGTFGTPDQAAVYKTAYIAAFNAAKPAIVPAGWVAAGNGAENITVGSNNGVLSAWIISTVADAQGNETGSLSKYDNTSTGASPWVAYTAKDDKGAVIGDFDDISTSSDGTVCAVSAVQSLVVNGVISQTGGDIYRLDDKKDVWTKLPNLNAAKTALVFDGVSVGNKDDIWATEAGTDNCYQLVKSVWELRSTSCNDIAIGLGGHAVGINTANNVYEYNEKNKSWTQIYYKDANNAKQPLQLTQIAVGTEDAMYGINSNNGMNDLWFYNKATKNWECPKSTDGKNAQGFVAVGCNAAGNVMAIDGSDNIWSNYQSPAAKNAPAQASKPAPTTTAEKAARVSKKAQLAKTRAANVAIAKTQIVKTGKVDKNGKAITKAVKVRADGKVVDPAGKAVGKKGKAQAKAEKAMTAKAAAPKAAAKAAGGEYGKTKADKIRPKQAVKK